jgi:hypothetical protein
MRYPRRVWISLAAGGVLGAILALGATCGACGQPRGAGPAASSQAPSASAVEARASLPPDARALRDARMWTVAKDGEDEDLATLAVHEGAAGLVEAAADPELRATAIAAMAHAGGWAQLPFLATTAAGKDETEARSALASIAALAVRPRRSEDAEDAEELREGCEKLLTLARTAEQGRYRRVGAVRALRMIPCPPAELPADVDTR